VSKSIEGTYFSKGREVPVELMEGFAKERTDRLWPMLFSLKGSPREVKPGRRLSSDAVVVQREGGSLVYDAGKMNVVYLVSAGEGGRLKADAVEYDEFGRIVDERCPVAYMITSIQPIDPGRIGDIVRENGYVFVIPGLEGPRGVHIKQDGEDVKMLSDVFLGLLKDRELGCDFTSDKFLKAVVSCRREGKSSPSKAVLDLGEDDRGTDRMRYSKGDYLVMFLDAIKKNPKGFVENIRECELDKAQATAAKAVLEAMADSVQREYGLSGEGRPKASAEDRGKGVDELRAVRYFQWSLGNMEERRVQREKFRREWTTIALKSFYGRIDAQDAAEQLRTLVDEKMFADQGPPPMRWRRL